MDDVASAIADPVRREILVLLGEGSLTAGEIAGRFEISRPAVSRHLRVLRESELVHDEIVGRQRVYRRDTRRLVELSGWLARLLQPPVTEGHLDALETEVHRTRREHRGQAGPPNRKADSA